MKIIFFFVILTGLIFVSCEKQDFIDDTIADNNDNSYVDNDGLIKMFNNPYFPLDTNDIWIYTTTTHVYDDIIDEDGNDNSYSESQRDTLKTSKDIIIDTIVVRRFLHNFFNTQTDKISLIIDSNRIFIDENHIIDILYTNKNDTNWTYTVGKETVTFNQSKVKGTDEIKLTIQHAFIIGLDENYTFKKDTGIVYSNSEGSNTWFERRLVEYINN